MEELYIPAVVQASDTVDAQNGIFSRIGDAVSKGIPTAAISGALSVYNTFLDYTGKDTIDIAQRIIDSDEEWGNYYLQHQNAIDVAGFIGTSLIPGAIGVKALKLAQSGAALGPMGRALGLTASKKGQYLEEAIKQLGKSGGTITADVAAAKRAQLAWATGDQVLTSAAAELAIVATMNDSPIFEGQDWKDFTTNVAFGAAFGGVVGGVFEHFATRGVIKSVQTQIEKNRRLFDVVFDPQKLGLTKADEILNFSENILKLPEDTWNTNVKVMIGGKLQTRVLDTGEAFKTARKDAEKTAFDTLALKFNELAENNEVTGQAMYSFIYGVVQKGRAKGADPGDIIDEIQGYLQGVKKVSALEADAGEVLAPKQFFVSKEPTSLADVFSEVRTAKTGKQAFYLTTDDPSKIKFGSVARLGFDSIDEAFDEGYDAVLTKLGRVAINPKSEVIKRTPDQALKSKFYLDLETGQLTPKPVVTGADMIRKNGDFVSFKDAVRIKGQEFKQAMTAAADITKSALEASARFMWAKEAVTDGMLSTQRVIAWNDFPLLDRMLKMPQNMWHAKDMAIKGSQGEEVLIADLVNLPAHVNQLKLQWLEQTLQAAGGKAGEAIKSYDLRFLQAHLNVSRDWLEEAIASNFTATPKISNSVRGLEEYFKPTTLLVEWDNAIKQVVNKYGQMYTPAKVGPNHAAAAQLGHHYELLTKKRVNENAALSVLGEDAARLPDAAEELSQHATERGAGATSFGASNANYGERALQWVQETGKQVALISEKWKNATIEALNPFIVRIRDSKEASAELGVLTTALRRDARKYVLDTEAAMNGTYRLVDKEVMQLVKSGDAPDIESAIEFMQGTIVDGKPLKAAYQIQNEAVFEFLAQSMKLNRDRLSKKTVLANAMGQRSNLDPDVVYVPPVDTRKYPHFAFVVAKEKLGTTSDVAMITAKDADQLRVLAGKVGDDYEVIYKGDTAKYFKAKGQYDYNLQLNESQVNSVLRKRGVLGDFFPETRAENVLTDYVEWHAKQAENIVRVATQVKSRQFFSEMQFLSEQFTKASTSVVRAFNPLRSKIADPYQDYIKTALNINKQSEYPLIDSLNEFVDRVGTKMYAKMDDAWERFRGTKNKDLAALEETNRLMEEHGLGKTFGNDFESYLAANEKVPKNAVKVFFQKANYWLATATLRLDFANSIINTISTPIMLGTEMSSLKQLIKGDNELAGKLLELRSVQVPGQDFRVPSTTKLMGNAIKNFFGKDKLALIDRYVQNGDIKTTMQLYHEVLDDLAYLPNQAPSKIGARIDAAVEKGARITGNEFSEQFTRFVSADVMRQLTDPIVEAGKMTVKEQNSYISSFVNRVQGNYIASQRPVIFQGTTGAAVGLFQTYAFNVLQQLARHMENKDMKTLFVFGGLQSSIYGFNGLPFFDAINTHLIGNASGNVGHQDAYSLLPQADKELGDWMLYGTASAFPVFGDKWPSLYTRGDINPRHISILPINPLDIPAVSASIKLATSVKDFGKNVAKGADLSSAFLQALEHHGWSRPLAGFAQVLAGQSTTSKGGLISAANELETTSMLARIPERLIEFGGAARLMGSKPMDESVALNGFYRNKAYEATDRARLEALGKAVKTKLYGNQVPDDEEMHDLMQQYINSGGRIETFSSSIQRWMRDSNQSVVNQMARKLSSPMGAKQQMLMGGEPLQDYTTIANEEE